MRLSKLFGRTTRETPADAESISHQLLLRAGMISQGAAGVYTYLPLSWRVLRNIEQVIREEMDKAGGQELRLPALQPFELWETSGRYVSFGQSLFTLTDRKQHQLALGPTHEEVITDLARRFIQSYRDMPARPYQIQTKFRDEPRPRGGLLRVREFIMKDMYSFDADQESLDVTYRIMAQAYATIYQRLGVPAVMVEADSGAIGGKASHEFMALTPTGEDIVMHCPSCGYAANMEKASSGKAVRDQGYEADEPIRPLEEVATPDSSTIEDVAAYLHVSCYKTLKAVFYVADGQFVIAVIRGDMEINDVKLQRALKCTELRLAESAEVQAAGVIAGFCSPIGASSIRVVADDSVPDARNLVAGANRVGYHFMNSNYGRDYVAETVADIALAHENDACPRCGSPLRADRGIEVGHIFKLGTLLSEKLSASFLDDNGVSRPPIMGCYGIGLGRLLAAVIEYSHDDKGIVWPMSLSPYHIHICTINPDKGGVSACGEQLYEQLQAAGIEVLYDDSVASPGVKFNDADLIGIPIRVTISPRTVASNNIEVKLRTSKESTFVPVDEAPGILTRMVRDALAGQTADKKSE